jgi:hypothetical protein
MYTLVGGPSGKDDELVAIKVAGMVEMRIPLPKQASSKNRFARQSRERIFLCLTPSVKENMIQLKMVLVNTAR